MKKIFITLAFCLMAFPANAQFMMLDAGKASGTIGTLAIDGTPQTTTTRVGATQAVTLSTTSAGDVIYVVAKAATPDGTNTTKISSIADTAGLTWYYRTNSECTGGNGNGMTTISGWYAIAGSPLTSDVITVTYDRAPPSARLVVFAVSGVDTTTPFDSNASIPSCGGTSGQTSPYAKTISTTSTNTMLVGAIAVSSGFGTITRPSGFTQIVDAGTATDVSRSVVSSAQSSVSESWSWTGGTQDSMEMFIDAIRASGSP